jgi:hypothetical protein
MTDELTTDKLETEVTKLVKTFGKPTYPSLDSTITANINLPTLSIDGTKLDIVIGMFDREGVIASKEVKETLAVLVLEASKALKMEIDDLVKFSSTQAGKLSMTALGVGMINLLRPNTSQLGFSIASADSAKTVQVNRNILP